MRWNGFSLRRFDFSAPPEREHENLSSTSRLLEKQREVTEAESLLSNQKEVSGLTNAKICFSCDFLGV